MKRHKPKRRDPPCTDCLNHGVQYSAGEFIDWCRNDGTRIETEPVYCPDRVEREQTTYRHEDTPSERGKT